MPSRAHCSLSLNLELIESRTLYYMAPAQRVAAWPQRREDTRRAGERSEAP